MGILRSEKKFNNRAHAWVKSDNGKKSRYSRVMAPINNQKVTAFFQIGGFQARGYFSFMP